MDGDPGHSSTIVVPKEKFRRKSGQLSKENRSRVPLAVGDTLKEKQVYIYIFEYLEIWEMHFPNH